MPAARFGQCSVYDPDDGLMLVFGGRNATDCFWDVWAYDFALDKWTVQEPVTDEIPLVRAYSSAVWNPHKKEFLIYGGENPNVTFLSTWAYSYANNTWIHRTGNTWTSTGLSMQGACYMGDRGLMPLFGGRWHPGNLQYEYTNNTWMYDAESDSFSGAASAPIPGAARAGAAAVYDPVRKRALVIGGSGPAGNCLNETWAFSAGTMDWSYFTPGYMEPPAVDLGENFSSLDKVSWVADMPAGTAVSVRIRASADNSTFGPFVNVANGARPVVQGRYIRWNMTLAASPDALLAPIVHGVRFDHTVDARPTVSGGEDRATSKHQAVKLNGSASDPDGDPLTYKWVKLSPYDGVFDDPTRPDASYTPVVSGVHMLQLVVNDSFYEVAAPYITVAVGNSMPVVSPGPDLYCFKGETVTPAVTASDPDGDALFCNWTFLPGGLDFSSTTSLRPSVSSNKAGNYTLILKVDDGESSLICTTNLTVFSRPPMARLDASPSNISLNGKVNFSAARSSDADGNITRYLFDFGDGNDTGWTVKNETIYVYTVPGIYNATLTVQDDDGNLSAVSAAVRISVTNELPVIDATVVPSMGNISTSFRFTLDASSYDPDGKLVGVEWNFGDGTSSSGTTVAHTYSERGNYTVVLEVTDDAGGVSRMNLSVSVRDRAPVILSANPVTAPEMAFGKSVVLSVSARDPDGDALNYAWTVDGKATGGNQESFTYKPTRSGTHVISVSVSDGEQAVTNEWTATVKVVNPPPEGMLLLPLLLGILVAVMLAAAIMVLVIRRRRR
jgi:PKD repeat protein